ncbi:MAG: hypothetical protein LBR91_02470 [Puniceicoccales bacterium]|jgi:tyrosine-specific transport protein|nr:hypothetical protein [Puniceicoccales bacterium]
MKTQNKKSDHGSCSPWKKFTMVVLFVAGNAIGASVLGLPVVMHAAGFIPACIVCILMSVVMAAAELLMVRIFIESGADDLCGMFRAKLGPLGANLFAFSYFALFFCLLVAYWSGTRDILRTFPRFNTTFPLLILLSGCCILFGFKVAGPANTFLTTCMFVTFLCLGLKTFTCEGGNLTKTVNFGATTAALSIVICSYCFHGAIPMVCRQLDFNRRIINWAVICGVLFPLMFNIGILFVSFRVLTAQDLAVGAANECPVFVVLDNKLLSKEFSTIGNLFSIFAILSSLIGVTTTMKGAIGEICSGRKVTSAVAGFTIVLLLPLAIALSCPGMFLKALRFSGGILSNFMVEILPIAVLIKEKKINLKYCALLLIFLWIFCLEFASFAKL